MIDNTYGYERMYFMNGFLWYNQIKMYPEDEKHTAFRTPLGVYYYTVMPFGLKNAGATYQRAMNTIFYEYLLKKIECYMDDIEVKSQNKDALALLVTSLALPPKVEMMIFVMSRELYHPKLPLEDCSNETTAEIAFATSIELEPRDWWFPYIDYVLYGILPDDSKEMAIVKWMALRFYYDVVSQTLY
ncbi:uncharacterized protein LOC109846924 [Asparagus officinalis]|uniref:uncharacterized protein LOC109846924 n=1 Tax=Asparagus officinalis TaxID=4686 RepID=UPI00098E83A0|nr:uncharacterized protein LOC109846924 [Asparagus officinalis]